MTPEQSVRRGRENNPDIAAAIVCAGATLLLAALANVQVTGCAGLLRNTFHDATGFGVENQAPVLLRKDHSDPGFRILSGPDTVSPNVVVHAVHIRTGVEYGILESRAAQRKGQPGIQFSIVQVQFRFAACEGADDDLGGQQGCREQENTC